MEETVSVASCARCGRSGHLSTHGPGFWCGWCARECEIAIDSVSVITKETAERHTVDGALVDPENAPLQALRITGGWKVQYNNALYEVDPTENTVKWWWIFKEDMLTLVHEERNRLLDLGWTPEMDFENGRYRLALYEGDFHGRLLRSHEGQDRRELVAEIETILEKVSNGAL